MISNRLMSTIIEDFYMAYVISGDHGDIYPKYKCGKRNLYRKNDGARYYNYSSLGPIRLYLDTQVTDRSENKIYYYGQSFYQHNSCYRKGSDADYYHGDSLRKSEDIFCFARSNYISPQIKM